MKTETAVIAAVLSLVCNGQAQQPADGKRIAEDFLCNYREHTAGGFTHRWIAYLVEPEEADTDQGKHVELNGTRHGPFDAVSPRFATSQDGLHIAFAALTKDKWQIFLDGQMRWTNSALGITRCTWAPTTLEEEGIRMDTPAVVLHFTPDGNALAYLAQTEKGQWAYFTNGVPAGTAWSDVGVSLEFVHGKMTYVAWTQRGQVQVWGDAILGPYDEIHRAKYSRNREHFCFIARKAQQYVLIADGREVGSFPNPPIYEIGPKGDVSYAFQTGSVWRVVFKNDSLPADFDEVADLKLSESGEHLGVWGRTGTNWTLMTEQKKLPGFDGCYYYKIGGISYSILWGPGETSIGYWARKGRTVVFVVDGEEREAPNLDAFGYAIIDDEKGNRVGRTLSGASRFDPAAFVKAVLTLKTNAYDALSPFFVGDAFGYVASFADLTYVLVGKAKEGPFNAVHRIIRSTDGTHRAYVVATARGQQIVYDGEILDQVYEGIYRPFFLGNGTFVSLGVRAGKVFRLTVPPR